MDSFLGDLLAFLFLSPPLLEQAVGTSVNQDSFIRPPPLPSPYQGPACLIPSRAIVICLSSPCLIVRTRFFHLWDNPSPPWRNFRSGLFLQSPVLSDCLDPLLCCSPTSSVRRRGCCTFFRLQCLLDFGIVCSEAQPTFPILRMRSSFLP